MLPFTHLDEFMGPASGKVNRKCFLEVTGLHQTITCTENKRANLVHVLARQPLLLRSSKPVSRRAITYNAYFFISPHALPDILDDPSEKGTVSNRSSEYHQRKIRHR